MRDKITEGVFATVTFSKMEAGKMVYGECGAAIASSKLSESVSEPVGGGLTRLLVTLDELAGNSPQRVVKTTSVAQRREDRKSSIRETITRMSIGEKLYVLYKALEDGQKVTFRSCFPGTIMRWNATPLADGENYVDLDAVNVKSVNDDNDADRPHGILRAVKGSFLVAEYTVKTSVYHTKNVGVKAFSETGDAFQEFSGNGKVFLEVHGGLQEIPLYPGESVDVWPGHLLAFTDGVTLEMHSAGDVNLRNAENNDYVIRLTAGEKGGYVYIHSVKISDFRFKLNEGK